jgi:hypothetical protein
MSEIDAIFDAFHRTSKIIHSADAIRRKEEQIESVRSKRCGNCRFWMTSQCKPEKEMRQFKSMSSQACEEFSRDHSSLLLDDQFSSELTDLRKKHEQLLEGIGK